MGKSPEEALYTFYMPEGAVVTSLSLWINGNEEKAILTTKEKAVQRIRLLLAKKDVTLRWFIGRKEILSR